MADLPPNRMPHSTKESRNTDFEILGGFRLIRFLALALIGSGAVIGSSQFFFQGSVRPGSIFLLALGTLSLTAVLRRHTTLATLLLCWGTFAGIHFASLLQAGLYGSAWAALAVSTMLSGWLLGWRYTAVQIVMNFVGIWWIYRLHTTGSSFQTPSIEVAAATYALVPVLGAIIGVLTGASFRRRFRESDKLRRKLAATNEDLERRVAERSASLVEALENIQHMQSEMAKNEKLASLGALVAGISHELNTPIGNALTVSSTLDDKSVELQALINSGTVRRSELTQAIAEFGDAAKFVRKSVERSAELIASFKQVSIDQTSERRRIFKLSETIQDIVQTLAPTIKKAHCTISVDVAEGAVCDSYPGPLGQVLTNLVINATQHAFENRSNGHVNIHAEERESAIHLRVADNGTGMPEAVLHKVFDPFFTTKLGQGGSGLGLAICHRICTNVLGGSIRVESTLGSGTTFFIEFPKVAHGKIG
jgi:signal transduction histidine kinase